MSDLNTNVGDTISRQDAINALDSINCCGWVEDSWAKVSGIIEHVPSAQRTGRWIWDDEGYHCSECFYHAYGNTSEVMLGDFKFCPNCGAEMEVGNDE